MTKFMVKYLNNVQNSHRLRISLFIHQMSATVDLMCTVLCVFAMFIIEIKLINVDSSVFMCEGTCSINIENASGCPV